MAKISAKGCIKLAVAHSIAEKSEFSDTYFTHVYTLRSDGKILYRLSAKHPIYSESDSNKVMNFWQFRGSPVSVEMFTKFFTVRDEYSVQVFNV